ncbi:hypothetical protein [Paractinoplanes durhamensis]
MSPFQHVPDIAAATTPATALLVMTALGVALSLTGLLGLQRRDLQPG